MKNMAKKNEVMVECHSCNEDFKLSEFDFLFHMEA